MEQELLSRIQFALTTGFHYLFPPLSIGLGLLILSNPVANSLTIYTAASSQKTLGIMLVVALLGMPVVLAYTVSIYWVFRGKVRISESSY